MKQEQFYLDENDLNYANKANSNFLEPQLIRVQSDGQMLPWERRTQPPALHNAEEIQPGTLHAGESIEPGTLHGGESIEPGTLHYNNDSLIAGTLCASYTPATYRTRDGSAFYKFRYVDIGGKFEIDILSQSLYGSRDSSLHASHRLPSSRGGYKICISVGHEPRTLEKAKKISMEWAELTHTYIQTGRTIDSQVTANARSSTPQNVPKKGFWERLFG